MSLWGWISPERIQGSTGTISPQEAAKLQEEARLKREAQQKVDEEGVAICNYCGEEIRKNEAMASAGWTWESEYMLGWCDLAKDRKHSPKLSWSKDEV